jgi:hypothetical protein
VERQLAQAVARADAAEAQCRTLEDQARTAAEEARREPGWRRLRPERRRQRPSQQSVRPSGTGSWGRGRRPGHDGAVHGQWRKEKPDARVLIDTGRWHDRPDGAMFALSAPRRLTRRPPELVGPAVALRSHFEPARDRPGSDGGPFRGTLNERRANRSELRLAGGFAR